MIGQDRAEIEALLCRFMQAFDERDWTALRTCLDARVFCDYSSLRGQTPGEISADEYVAQRSDSLSSLRMQHNFSNLQTAVDGDRASARCNYLILRFLDEDRYFHSFGHYRFEFLRRDGSWKVSSITQNLLQNVGDPSIHGGVKKQA